MSTNRIAVVHVVSPEAIAAAEASDALQNFRLELLAPLELGVTLVQPLEEVADQLADRRVPFRGPDPRPR